MCKRNVAAATVFATTSDGSARAAEQQSGGLQRGKLAAAAWPGSHGSSSSRGFNWHDSGSMCVQVPACSCVQHEAELVVARCLCCC